MSKISIQKEEGSEATPVASVWIVVVSKVGQERRVKHELQQQGFEVYLPMKLTENRRRELVASPFLPRYLFARVTLAVERWKSIYSTMGVAGVLGRGERPTGVKDKLVQRIRDQEDGGFIRLGLETEAQLAKGDRVGFEVAGVDLEGLFEERVDARRVLILASFLGRDSRFVVDLADVRAAEAKTK